MNNIRIWFIFFVIFLIFGAVLARLFYLQVLNGDYYKAMAQGKQNQIYEAEGKRGSVFFSNGEVLAITTQDYYLFFSPDEIEDKEYVADVFSDMLGLDSDELLEKASVEGSLYQKVLDNITEEQMEEVLELGIEGVHIGETQKRYYPNADLASQIIGFINSDNEGQYGIESYYDDDLAGEERVLKKNFTEGSLMSLLENEIDGEDLTLTIDYNIQFKAEELLDAATEEYDARSGLIIVMNPNTGAIIALAQSPRFDPNTYGQVEDYNIFKNDAVQNSFEPGSIFKPITMAAALNEGKVTPETTYEDNEGCRYYQEDTICNYKEKAWGVATMTNVLENSINTGVIFAEEQIGNEKFIEYVEKFGLLKKTGIDLANEILPSNKDLETSLLYGIETKFANASFGQGIAMTPMQMIRGFTVIANGGKLVRPYIVKQIGDEEVEPEIISEGIITAKTSTDLTKMLVSVVENGFGKQAKISGYYIAGKTGTSQVPWSSIGVNKAGYSDESWQTFMGFAPAYNPQFIILVKLDNPTATQTSEYSAVPLFHDLAKYIFNYWKIPFDYSVEE